MSSTINCHVDTLPMAQTMSSVSTHVNGTTAAVVAMKAAVVKAETDGANFVCDRVNKGFYSLIRSQISQKIAKLKSDVDSHLMRLNQQRKQLIAIKSRMERDYQMISGRYFKIFTSLNKSLEQRVTELDRPIMQFAKGEADKVSNRSAQLTAGIPLGQIESVKTAQIVEASNLKFRASKAIESIDKFIDSSNQLQDVTDKILLRRRMTDEDKSSALLSIPVAFVETNFDASDQSTTRTYVHNDSMPTAAQAAINAATETVIRNELLQWYDTAIPDEVANEFRRIVSTSGLDQRRQQMIVAMFESHPYQSF